MWRVGRKVESWGEWGEKWRAGESGEKGEQSWRVWRDRWRVWEIGEKGGALLRSGERSFCLTQRFHFVMCITVYVSSGGKNNE
ncbi:hypothetical protein ACF0H5_016405 [Mactra antiquata]